MRCQVSQCPGCVSSTALPLRNAVFCLHHKGRPPTLNSFLAASAPSHPTRGAGSSFARRQDFIKVLLEPLSLLVLEGPSRYNFTHAIRQSPLEPALPSGDSGRGRVGRPAPAVDGGSETARGEGEGGSVSLRGGRRVAGG